MKLHEGATVTTAQGRKVGRLQRLVVDRADRDVGYLVVEKGMLLPRDALVPIEDVARTEGDDTIVLQPGSDPERFEPYVEERFAAMYRLGSSGLMPMPAVPPVPAAEAATPVPEGSTVVEAGAAVIAGDGKRLGRVEELVVDADGTIDSLVVRSGMLWFTRRHVIPVGWVADVTRDAVRLTVPRRRARRDAAPGVGQLPVT